MLTIVRAFAWLRWRVLVNSFERTGARDTLERFSIATDKLGPILALILLIPSAIALGALALIAGYGLATSEWLLPFELIRYFVMIATFMTLVGPIVLPSRDAGNAVRFLLLPIPRGVLFAAQTAGAIADPWILLLVPLLVLTPAGLLAGGGFAMAAIAAVAALTLLVFVMAVTSLVSSLIHLLLRDRRRSDLVMLFLVLGLPLIGALPALFQATGVRDPLRHARQDAPGWVRAAAVRAFSYIPSELYHRSIVTARTDTSASARPVLLLAGADVALLALGFAAYRRLLEMPASMTARRGGSFGGLWGRTLPGLGPGASAVAWTQVRLALRTPRGRATLGAPLLMFVVFAVMAQRTGGFRVGGFTVTSGLPVAAFAGFICLVAILPIAMNQFAVDRAGFTRQMLSPLSLDEVLAGKAVGNGLVSAAPAFVCVVLAGLLFGGGPFALWVALVLALIATYVTVSPVAAALSAVFPRSVDLNSIGNASNAHPAAVIIGLISFLISAGPCALLVVLATSVMRQPVLAPLFLLIWCGVTFVIARLLFIPVRRLVANRSESLAHA